AFAAPRTAAVPPYFFLFTLRPAPCSTLFPYTTLFRSVRLRHHVPQQRCCPDAIRCHRYRGHARIHRGHGQGQRIGVAEERVHGQPRPALLSHRREGEFHHFSRAVEPDIERAAVRGDRERVGFGADGRRIGDLPAGRIDRKSVV